jgi:gluconokinase
MNRKRPRRCSEREPAGSLRDKSNVTGGWHPSLTFAFSKKTMKVPGLRSAYDEVGGIVYFGRMLDKIRLKARGALPADYNTGTKEWYDFDSRCARFLKVKYGALKERTLRGGSDLQILRWCFRNGRKLSKEEIEIWNTFMKKRGWRDGSSEGLAADKRAAGLAARSDIVTWFDLFDADEQRPNA